MWKQVRTVLAAALLGGVLLAPGTAEAKFVFPYNHPDLEWYSIETEHFVVHYPKSREEEGNDHFLTTEWTAKKTAQVSEEMWPRMCAEFNYYLKEKVHIVLLNQSDELEGFTIPSWDWIEISANPGADFYRQRGRMDWLPDVLVHEFAHVVSLKANGTFSEGVQGISVGGLYTDGVGDTQSGAEVFLMDGDPFYWTEGGAEYWSDNAGYNWWTPSRDMHIRTTVLEDRLLTWEEWHTRAQTFRWGDGERGYQQGYSFALYLRQRFGNDIYAKFALEYAKGWRADWNTVIEDVTGVPGKQLYEDWVAYLEETYQAQWAQVRAEGEVVGFELNTTSKAWEYTDPDGRDKFNDLRWKRKKGITGPQLARIEREKAKEGTGRWEIVPRYSDDGEWFGVQDRAGVNVMRFPETSWAAFTGSYVSDAGVQAEMQYGSFTIPSDFMESWDFIPGRDALVVTGSEHGKPGPAEFYTGFRAEMDGYNWKQLWVVPIPQAHAAKDGNIEHLGLKRSVLRPGRPSFAKEDQDAWQPIPNTLRATAPVVSPDGTRVAYSEYTDGVLNLVTINLDGTDKKRLTSFDDGTWLQRHDWSPDGKQIVTTVFRNHQQDLFLMNADGTDVRPLMYDRWEDQDPFWADDGHIYFSSDPNGIFNIYAYDLANRKVYQVTNVIGGAEAPSITPEGNLVYSNYTAHGWKAYGVRKEDFLWNDVTAKFVTTVEPAVVSADWSYREDLSAYVPEKYTGGLMAPTGVPMFRLSNDSRDDVSIQAGGQVFLQDFVENHGAFVYGLLGSDVLLLGQYFYQGWYPTLFLTAYHYEVKFTYGFLLDDDEDPTTTNDQALYEGKNQQYANILQGAIQYPWNDRWNTTLFGRGLEYGFKTSSDAKYLPYQVNIEGGAYLNFSNIAYLGMSANPFGGRNVDLTYTHGFTDVVYEPYGGHTTDDGEVLDAYNYNKVELRWTEQVLVPAWGPVLKAAQDHRHVIQVDFQGGFIDRNVDLNDEFRAGGQHPFYWGSDSLRPNTQFSGFPSYSLSGETMAMLNIAYRFPIRRELNRKIGPFYFYDVTAQVMGTAGNLWSYRIPYDESKYYRNEYGDRVVRDPNDIRREIPFVDSAYKNGNYLLYDAGTELRVSGGIFNGAYWNSFVRVAYGFNEVRGYGDVNGDDIQDTTDNAIGDELSNETEMPGPRVYIGLGTGW